MPEVVEGLQQLLKDLEELPLTIGRRLIASALRKAAKPVQERISQLAPDDPKTPGSRVRQNIGVNITEQTATGAVALIGPTKRGFMGGFAEFGTKHQSAQPFIAPGFDQSVEEATNIMAEDLGDAIEQELTKL